MEEEGLLIQNPEVALNLGLGASVYAESALFKLVPDNDEGRLSKEFELPLASLEMHALPAYSDLERTSSETARSISGKFEKYSMIICEEKGFAIFEEGNDTPLQHIALSKGHESGKTSNDGTKAIELPKEEGSASFSIADSDKVYDTRPYAKAYGICFYGEGESIWVDLGLPSGILWAAYNVGATSPEEYGNYYAWGETFVKSSYTEENYKYFDKWIVSGYDKIPSYINIGENISATSYDVVKSIDESADARMATILDLEELVNYCTIKKEIYCSIKGYRINGQNGNSIFVPSAGAYEDDDNELLGYECYFWIGNAAGIESSYHFSMDEYEDKCIWDDECERYYGLPIRAVKDKGTEEESE